MAKKRTEKCDGCGEDFDRPDRNRVYGHIGPPSKEYCSARCYTKHVPRDVTIERALRFMADLNGSNWIEGDGAGEIDMRQRAKSLQSELYELLKP